jgi:hypothetical protein
MKYRLILLLLLFAPALKITASNDAPLERATLRGLQAINVVIDTLDPELIRDGLTQDALESRVVERLMQSGIKRDKDAREFLGIRASQVRDRRGPVALCLSAGLYQPVVLTRNKDIHTVTQTWEVVTVLMVDSKHLNEVSLENVEDLTGRFVKAYQGVNGPSAQK